MMGRVVSVKTKHRVVIVNGIEIPFPEGMTGRNISIIGNSVTIDGYRLVDGDWQKKPASKPQPTGWDMLRQLLFG